MIYAFGTFRNPPHRNGRNRNYQGTSSSCLNNHLDINEVSSTGKLLGWFFSLRGLCVKQSIGSVGFVSLAIPHEPEGYIQVHERTVLSLSLTRLSFLCPG